MKCGVKVEKSIFKIISPDVYSIINNGLCIKFKAFPLNKTRLFTR